MTPHVESEAFVGDQGVCRHAWADLRTEAMSTIQKVQRIWHVGESRVARKPNKKRAGASARPINNVDTQWVGSKLHIYRCFTNSESAWTEE